MGVLIIAGVSAVGIIMLVGLVMAISLLSIIADNTEKILDKPIKTEPNKATVTNPSKRRNLSVSTSTKNIIVPKTPIQIRNENYEKIRGSQNGRTS